MAVTQREKLYNGTHWRLQTDHGPVHVWVPDAGASDGVVVYVHGYYDNADQAWQKYSLASQFAQSGRSATFIVPEAPLGSGNPVNWPSLDPLLADVAADTGRLDGPVTVIGHSGAYRTILPWLSNPRIQHVTLLDALYAGTAQFLAWGRMPGHTLDIVVTPTGAPRDNLAAVQATIQGLVKRTGVPLDGAALGAKFLAILSPLTHFALITPGTSLIPGLLRRAPAVIGGLGLVLALGLGAAALWVAYS